MEYLDTYDENRKFIKKESRDYVHKNGLWHNTVHCWLYDLEGNIYFQIRADQNKLYTTASGHVLAGETIEEAFGREIKEEIGIDVEYLEAKFIELVIWKMDKVKEDGSVFRDRAFANVYACQYQGTNNFNFDPEEVSGVVKVNIKETLNLLKKGKGQIKGEIITNKNGKKQSTENNINFEDFLVNNHETALGKYGNVLNKIIEFSQQKN